MVTSPAQKVAVVSTGSKPPAHLSLSIPRRVDRNGEPSRPGESWWKGTVWIRSGETVRILPYFVDFRVPFVSHRHCWGTRAFHDGNNGRHLARRAAAHARLPTEALPAQFRFELSRA